MPLLVMPVGHDVHRAGGAAFLAHQAPADARPWPRVCAGVEDSAVRPPLPPSPQLATPKQRPDDHPNERCHVSTRRPVEKDRHDQPKDWCPDGQQDHPKHDRPYNACTFACALNTEARPKLLFLQVFWRKGWDSNPRYPCGHAGFQDRCLKPLGHPSQQRIAVA